MTLLIQEYAIFCISKPEVDIANLQKYPFYVVAAYEEAVKLVILPIKSFHRLANDLGDPKLNVVMIYMTARYVMYLS